MSEEKKGSPSKYSAARSRNKNKKERQSVPVLVKVTADFAACPRCSYFWAGYRVIAGEAAMQTAVAEATATGSQWLTLTWNQAMNELLHKSYGAEIDASYDHYEGRCRECRRLFVRSAKEVTAVAEPEPIVPDPVAEEPLPEEPAAELELTAVADDEGAPTETAVPVEVAVAAEPPLTQPIRPPLIRGLHVDDSLQTVVDDITAVFAADYSPKQFQIQLLRQH